MNKVMPYMFWIVCGGLLLIEIILMLAISPHDPEGKSPSDTLASVTTQNKKFQELVTQAHNGPPSGSYDPLETDQMNNLMTKYLDTPFWKKPLDDELDLYTNQMMSIRDYLLERSKLLHVPISTNTDFTWYQDYENVTAELLKNMYENKCLLLPPKRGMGPTNAQPPGAPVGGPGAGHAPPSAVHTGSGTPAGTPADSGQDADAAPDFALNKDYRKVAGFMTREGNYPNAEPQGGVNTEQFRMMQVIAGILEASKATNDFSPVDPKRPPYEEHAKLVSTAFSTEDEHTVSIVLQGPLSALLAVESALEENKDDSQPVRVVLNGSLERKNYTSEERLHVSSEPVVLKLSVAFLDFEALRNEKVDYRAAASTPAAKPAAKPAARASAPPPPSGKGDD